jgi:hypothetical protein
MSYAAALKKVHIIHTKMENTRAYERMARLQTLTQTYQKMSDGPLLRDRHTNANSVKRYSLYSSRSKHLYERIGGGKIIKPESLKR